MEVGAHHNRKRTSARLTSTLQHKPELDTQTSPRLERQNTGSSWMANLQTVRTPKLKDRQIIDFDRLVSMSTEKVGSFPVLESRMVEHQRALTDRIDNSNIQLAPTVERSVIKAPSTVQPVQQPKNRCCCNLFQRRIVPPVKIAQLPKKLKRPMLNQLVVEKRKIKVVTSQRFNERRKVTICLEEKHAHTPTNVSSFQLTPRHY